METISAFMDGAAGRAESKMTFLQLRQSDECMDAWETFHLIGDTLRGEPVLSQGFTRRFTARLEDQLDDIANGEAKWTAVMAEMWAPLSALSRRLHRGSTA